jgi:putative nucleotidyltransferase with HDIG domain
MLKRINQVVSALTATITDADRDFVGRELRPAEQRLFWNMNKPDQRHALNVAYTALRLAKDRTDIDKQLLTQCALLHDVGKVKGDVSTFDKIAAVIAYKIAPDWARKWAKEGRGSKVANLRHAFHTYFHHAGRSAAFLKQIGSGAPVIAIVSRHHDAPGFHDIPELTLLREADELN